MLAVCCGAGRGRGARWAARPPVMLRCLCAEPVPRTRVRKRGEAKEATKSYPPAHFAVIGSGPSGFYTAHRLLLSHPTARVDMVERWPVPFGLVRYGVAPDHENTKNVQNQFNDMMDDERFRFIGNVVVGEDVDIHTLAKHYSGVIVATGCNTLSHLGLPGEDLGGIHSAGEFVSWYTGHPLFHASAPSFPLHRVRSVCVVGVGNVALDVARVLLKGRDGMAGTDVPECVMDALGSSSVREVHIVGRRRALEAAFTNPELREITTQAGWSARLATDHPDALDLTVPDGAERSVRRRMQLLTDANERQDDGGGGAQKRLVFHFLKSPVEFTGADGHVTGVRLVHNRIEQRDDGRSVATPTSTTTHLPCQLVLKSTGYSPNPIRGLPFDHKHNCIPNTLGRVLLEPSESNGRVFVAGWAKRGPTGIIATNLVDASQTVAMVLEDLEAGKLPTDAKGWDAVVATEGLAALDAKAVGTEGWRRIKAVEESEGERLGKPREKLVRVDRMLQVARGAE